jgi:1-acyl-sn-glycerol-3-phosphate acyltransferase|tara:strand:- start:40 stop:1398 length:1359 start_codon:yes stop_codon:yes gene_type:complete
MLYFLLRLLGVLFLERYFDKIIVAHAGKVDYDRPTIFVANHPNTMMDALIVGYAVRKRLYFVAKSTIFANRFSSWFLTKAGGVPIYRKQDAPSKTIQNVEVFEKLYDFLEAGRPFLIFPEGISMPDRRLHRIKTGTARIALGIEERNDFELGVQIVPVGLNYSDFESSRSNVYCRFGRPILPADYREDYLDDPVKTVNKLTEEIRSSMEHLITSVGEDEFGSVVAALETVYKKELMIDLGMDTKSEKDDFFITKGIIDAVQWLHNYHPRWARRLGEELRKYLRTLDRLHLRDDFLSPKRAGVRTAKRVRSWFFLVFGFPIYLWGAVNNFVPYGIPRWFTKHFTKQETFVSSVKMLLGIGSFAIFYGLQIWLCWYMFHDKLVTTLYTISLPITGNFALYYLRKTENYKQHLAFISLFYRRKDLMYRLIQQRMKLIEEFNRVRDEFMAADSLKE